MAPEITHQKMDTIYQRQNIRAPLVIILILLLGIAMGAIGLTQYTVRAIYAGFLGRLSGEIATVLQALEHAFIENDLNTVQTMVSNLSFRSQFTSIRVLNESGSILASSNPDEIGIRIDLMNPQCQPCHANPSDPMTSVRYLALEENGSNILVTANPVANQIACQGCHVNGGTSLGVILTEQDMTALQSQLFSLKLGIFSGAGLLFILLAGLVWFTYYRLVASPLARLASEDKFDTLLTRRDEFGHLARQFQGLKTSAQENGQQLDAQRRNFQALLALSESIDVTLTAEKVLNFAISKIQETTGFSNIAMRLFIEDQNCFRLVAQNGMSRRMVDDLCCIPADIGFTGDVYKTHRAAYTSDLATDPRLESPAPVESGFRSLISVPLLSGDRLMGSMELASKTDHNWKDDEVRWLELIGRSIGNVLHHIETSRQLQGFAVMQERALIAQEIHDGLAQLIGALRIWAEQAQSSLNENDLDQAQKDLQKIELAARDAYASLREEILGLRDTILPDKGIIPVIRGFLNRYRRQWGIETIFILRPSQQEELASLLVSPAAEIQLLRIIQEGLTNVRRHANATQVSVTIDNLPDRLLVEIRDNGQGFDPRSVPEDKLGLRIMNERAINIGGQVNLESTIGEGTHIQVKLPKQALPLEHAPSS